MRVRRSCCVSGRRDRFELAMAARFLSVSMVWRVLITGLTRFQRLRCLCIRRSGPGRDVIDDFLCTHLLYFVTFNDNDVEDTQPYLICALFFPIISI